MEIKVDNLSSYGFDPKVMLRDASLCLTHFAEFEEFCREVITSGYYDQGGPLRKLGVTAKKLQLLSVVELGLLERLLENVQRVEVRPLINSSHFDYRLS